MKDSNSSNITCTDQEGKRRWQGRGGDVAPELKCQQQGSQMTLEQRKSPSKVLRSPLLMSHLTWPNMAPCLAHGPLSRGGRYVGMTPMGLASPDLCSRSSPTPVTVLPSGTAPSGLSFPAQHLLGPWLWCCRGFFAPSLTSLSSICCPSAGPQPPKHSPTPTSSSSVTTEGHTGSSSCYRDCHGL